MQMELAGGDRTTYFAVHAVAQYAASFRTVPVNAAVGPLAVDCLTELIERAPLRRRKLTTGERLCCSRCVVPLTVCCFIEVRCWAVEVQWPVGAVACWCSVGCSVREVFGWFVTVFSVHVTVDLRRGGVHLLRLVRSWTERHADAAWRRGLVDSAFGAECCEQLRVVSAADSFAYRHVGAGERARPEGSFAPVRPAGSLALVPPCRW